MTIRQAQAGDAADIRSVIVEAAQTNRNDDLAGVGWNNFLAPNELTLLQARLLNENYLNLCYLLDDRIVGILSMRNFEIIDQLFVRPDARKMGVATGLWNAASKICIEQRNTQKFFVKSSTIAIPVYESFGFRVTGNKQVSNSISYTPMELQIGLEIC